jgi:hypothetical protein
MFVERSLRGSVWLALMVVIARQNRVSCPSRTAIRRVFLASGSKDVTGVHWGVEAGSWSGTNVGAEMSWLSSPALT